MKNENQIDSDQRTHKKAKIMVDQACGPEPEDEAGLLGGAIPETPAGDTPSPYPEQVVRQAGGKTTLRPKARPLKDLL